MSDFKTVARLKRPGRVRCRRCNRYVPHEDAPGVTIIYTVDFIPVCTDCATEDELQEWDHGDYT